MKIISHGKWTPYTPSTPPKHLPPNVLYYQRESDGKDWYEYIYQSDSDGGESTANRVKVRDALKASTIKCAAFFQDYYNAYIIGPAVRDITMIVPHNQHVFEIVDYARSDDPQEFFLGKAFSPDKLTISDERPPPANTQPPPHRFLIVEVNELKNVIASMQKQIDHLLGK